MELVGAEEPDNVPWVIQLPESRCGGFIDRSLGLSLGDGSFEVRVAIEGRV
jgi:hypothetical protein